MAVIKRNSEGLIHCEDGPAVELASGTKEWWINGKRHRLDGPAVEYFGGKEWWIKGKLHRKDGPTIERANGDKEYFYFVGKDTRGYKFYCSLKNDGYRVIAGCHDFNAEQALAHWKNNPECLGLAKLAIAKFGCWDNLSNGEVKWQ